MSSIERRIMDETVRSDHSDETLEEYRARKKAEKEAEAVEREETFRNDILRELRVMNRLKAIEIMNNASLAAIGNDYAFLLGISTQWCGTDAEVASVGTPNA